MSPQVVDRLRFTLFYRGLSLAIFRWTRPILFVEYNLRFQKLLDLFKILVAMEQGHEPATDVSATGDRREIIDFGKQFLFGECLEHSQIECSAANPTTGKADAEVLLICRLPIARITSGVSILEELLLLREHFAELVRVWIFVAIGRILGGIEHHERLPWLIRIRFRFLWFDGP